MSIRYEYDVVIQGNDWDADYGWHDEHYLIEQECFDNIEEAQEFVRGITVEQALAWEDESNCNGLDVIIIAYPIPDGGYECDWMIVGECEWIGDKLNLLDL